MPIGIDRGPDSDPRRLSDGEQIKQFPEVSGRTVVPVRQSPHVLHLAERPPGEIAHGI